MPVVSKEKDPKKRVKTKLADIYRPSKQATTLEQKLQDLSALEFDMALYYAQPWHGDLSNAIMKAELAFMHHVMLLNMQGKGKEDPTLVPFLHLLVAVYQLKEEDGIRPGERFNADIKRTNQQIAELYKKFLKEPVDFSKFPDSLKSLPKLDVEELEPPGKGPDDKSKETRKEIKNELVYKYYRGLGLQHPGFGAAEALGPWVAADLHRILALGFLAQPDYNNAIIHAELAKDDMLLLLGNDRRNPLLREFYETLLFIYNSMPDRTKYLEDKAIYEVLIAELAPPKASPRQ
jgi:hypothetical protein